LSFGEMMKKKIELFVSIINHWNKFQSQEGKYRDEIGDVVMTISFCTLLSGSTFGTLSTCQYLNFLSLSGSRTHLDITHVERKDKDNVCLRSSSLSDIYTYICIYVCMYVCMFIYIYIYIYYVRPQTRPRVVKVHRLRNEETKQFTITDHSGE
jgi:hypothetical protein